MTLTDIEEHFCMEFSKNYLQDVGKAARTVMSRSCTERRLTCGVVECARQLETEPDDVMMCILPEISAQNVPSGIQHTLMEAYCREFEIPVLKVESVSSLVEMFQVYEAKCISSKPNVTDNVNTAHAPLKRKLSYTRDYSCFLIRNPDVLSSDECLLKMFCVQISDKKEVIIEIPS
ncbi:uncharacterized protein LOC123525127 [Mercenaria mercenaria]|uniref:uncharacterized protein LOC123525127 n=1 Tax=Mercenaria mercenaria TaxID=6596 RepID=UPI001E1D2350|nr:uncharacterized protein LOC123525127 [Mercenaria mercenaria]